ncbi:MAG: tetratricopeptide repeat protein [Bryobacteraceae bacterium]
MYRVAVAVLCGGLLYGQSKPSPQELLKQAIALHQQGKFDQAIEDYELFLDMYPDVPEVRSNLAAALAGTGRYADAIVQYKRALDKKPDPEVRLNLALAYYKTANFPQAVAELEKVRAADPANGQAMLLLADCDLRRGDNKKVIDLLTPRYQANPGDLGVAYLLGTALAREGQTARAQEAISRIMSRGDSAEARLLMGTAKFTGHDYHGAIADIKKAIEMNPNLPDVYSYYGLALLYTGDQAGSKQAFEKELEHNPNNFDANLRLGILSRVDQDYEHALNYLQHALELRPGDLSTRFEIASVQLAQGKQEQARSELESIVKAAPSFTEAHVMLATIYYRDKLKAEGDRERAIIRQLNAERQAQQPGVRERQ